MRERNLAGSTIKRSRAHLDTLLDVERNGHRMLTWLTPRRAGELYGQLRARTAVDTHRNGLAAGKSLGRFAAERGWLPVDPFANAPTVPIADPYGWESRPYESGNVAELVKGIDFETVVPVREGPRDGLADHISRQSGQA